MSLQDVFEGVFDQLGLDIPPFVFGSALREHKEFARLVNRAAKDILRSHEWSLLKKQATITGDGAATTFDLPSDYDRRILGAQMYGSDIGRALEYVEDADEWLRLQEEYSNPLLDQWTIYGGQIHTQKTFASGVTGKYFYVSGLYCQPSSGDPTASFTANDDVFRLDENLLELSLVWRWKQLRQEDFQADMAVYNKELQRRISRDKGPGVKRLGAPRVIRGTKISDPWRVS